MEFPAPADPSDPDTLSTSVNRQTLREVLAARLDGDLEFGRACTGFEQHPDAVRLAFCRRIERTGRRPGRGGQRIHSPIRSQYLPHARLTDTGLVTVVGRTPLTEQTRPLIPEYTWRGFTAVAGPRRGMATGVLDFREPPAAAAARIAPDTSNSATRPLSDVGADRPDTGSPAGSRLGSVRLHAVAVDSIRRWHRICAGFSRWPRSQRRSGWRSAPRSRSTRGPRPA